MAGDRLDTFAAHLREDGAPVEDVHRIVTLLGRSAVASQQVYDTVSQIQSTTLGCIARRNPVLARSLIWVFMDHIEANETAVADAPVIVPHYQALARDVSDPVCQAAVVAGLLTFAHRRHDPDVVRAFEALAASALDGQSPALVREALLDFDPDRVMQAKNAIETSGTADTARQSLLQLFV